MWQGQQDTVERAVVKNLSYQDGTETNNHRVTETDLEKREPFGFLFMSEWAICINDSAVACAS